MTVTESLALRMLDREGIAIIWQLHTAAARAYQAGNARAAAAILELAEAAEREWLSNNAIPAK
jgi:hypothetical protein